VSIDLPRSAAGRGGPWVMILVISLATFMEILDTSIANVALDNIGGSLGVSYEESAWLVTTYLVANAVIIPISGFLTRAIGRKRYFMISILMFTLASLACALSPNLTVLLLARVVQGVGGGGLAPLEQSMIADSFPPEKRGLAFAAFGMVVVVGPIFGPTIGGWITDQFSWHWIFLINVPVGILALVLVSLIVVEATPLQQETARIRANGLKVDVVGFLLMAVGIGSLLVMLDRGQQDDWFGSTTIIVLAIASVLGIAGMVLWEFNHPDPIVPLPILKNRNAAICCLLMLILGMLVFGTIQLIPQLLQELFSYTAFNAGLALTIGGLFTMLLMPVSGILAQKADLRVLLLPAFALQALAFWLLAHFALSSTFWNAVQARFIMSIGLPFLFIPIMNAAYVGLKPGEADRISALLNFFRNLGGAFGISGCQTLLARREQFHQSRLAEHATYLDPNFASGIAGLEAKLGSSKLALAEYYQELVAQAGIMSYNDVFHMLMLSVILVLPLILVLRTNRG